MNDNVAIQITDLGKQYRLGTIGGGTLTEDLNRWWARKRGKEDPYAKIGSEVDAAEYGQSFWALDGINLEIKKGEAVGIIGHNGAGKSTLLKVLSRVTAPTTGEVKMRGRVSSMLEVGTGFHPELTGRENIYMNGAILGMSRKEVDAKIDQIIEFSECAKFIDTPVKRYSSGMYVKLAFSVAAHLDAEIMIMDEVLAVGDAKFQSKCLGRMGDAANTEGKTVLYVSHNMATIRRLCSRCIVLDHGRVIYDGDVEEAIALYMDVAKKPLDSVIDYRDVRRPEDHGEKFFLKQISFLNKDKLEIQAGEEIKFKIDWEGHGDIPEARVLMTICTMDSNPVGTFISAPFADVKDGDDKSSTMTFTMPGLVDGDYYAIVDIININEFGNHIGYDYPLRYIYFHMDNTKSEEVQIDWVRHAWSSVNFESIKVLDEKFNC